MEIKIAADDMYAVLVSAGIEQNDAKAIIFDLMLAADGKFKPQLPPPRPPSQVVARRPEPEPEPEVEAEDPNQSMRQPSKIRRKVVSFQGFGGPAEPLR